ncbi:hypothetical protein ARAM_004751 [Aspergillus rambellii]|uniref:Small nuclear ribonucleoprotein Prp3 C-terminal domain-containing protein n=1 Tax=Aspergillus rambellii TaxID=308745 RepID=A0A0F8U9I1_9EURO|nr:hypothetical protein ARAM_004751 [Aspergillus rambellii]
MAPTQITLLPVDMMESQLSTVDLLMGMFPSPGELEIPELTTQCIEKLRVWCEEDHPASAATMPPSGIPASISLAVRLPIPATEKTIHVNISIRLQGDSPEIGQPQPQPQPSPLLSYSVRQPGWMSKAEVAKQLTARIPLDDVFDALQYIQEEARHFIETQIEMTAAAAATAPGSETLGPGRGCAAGGPVVRVWFYLPSLSSRGKRDDLVNHAADYSLTGFVLAGKPGVLCLEGASADIDAYMCFIKTHSWGDIPSYQKKISEKFRETKDIHRVFSGMEEITDTLGARGGQKANRSDMQALEAWLRDRGLGEAFEQVIF